MHLRSDAHVIELVREQIRTRCSKNMTSLMTHRLTPEMLQHHVPATPIGIWNFLSSRHRTAAQPIGFDDAVRKFLTPVQFDFAGGKLKLSQLHYSSQRFRDALAKRGFRGRTGGGALKLTGYALSMCIRHAWVELDGRLYEVDAQLSFREDDEQLYMSLVELQDYPSLLRRARREAEDSRGPHESAIRQRGSEQIGSVAFRSRQRRGQAKSKSKESLAEKSDLLHGRTGGRE